MSSKLKQPVRPPDEAAQVYTSNGGHSSVVRSSRDRVRVVVRNSGDRATLTRTPSESIDARIWLVLESCRGSFEVSQSLGSDQTAAMTRATEALWVQLNQRRLGLIDKDIEHGLSTAEQAELDDLEKKAQEHLDANAPVSFEIIDRLKECAARDGLTVELD